MSVYIKHILLLFVVAPIALNLSGCGTSIEYDSKHQSIGNVIIFESEMFYSSNLKSGVWDKESAKYNCFLQSKTDTETLHEQHYKGNKKILEKVKKGMSFTVKKRFRVIPWGIKAGFGSEYSVLVLEDENGRLCTR